MATSSHRDAEFFLRTSRLEAAILSAGEQAGAEGLRRLACLYKQAGKLSVAVVSAEPNSAISALGLSASNDAWLPNGDVEPSELREKTAAWLRMVVSVRPARGAPSIVLPEAQVRPTPEAPPPSPLIYQWPTRNYPASRSA